MQYRLFSTTCLGFSLMLPGIIQAESTFTPKTITNGGIQVGDEVADFWFIIGGGLKIDETFFSGNYKSKGNEFKSGGNVRAGWVEFKGGVGKDFNYNLSFTLDDDSSKIKIGDIFISYNGLGKNTKAIIGQFCPGFSLHNNTDGSWTTFLESSLDSAAFSAGSGIGAKLSKWDKNYSFFIAANQPELGAKAKHPQTKNNSPTGNDIILSRSDRWHVTSRGTYSPYLNLADHQVFQIGASAYYKDNSNQGITFSTRPEARARHTTATLTTDNASNLSQRTKYISSKYHIMYALEISGQSGPLHAEAEYQSVRVRRSINAGRDLKFNGWHVQAAYVLTGEARTYNQDSGTFGKIIPQSNNGAWEAAIRYSYVNLNNKDIRGGIGNNITFGINYYANKNIRVAVNYIKSKQKLSAANRNLNIFGARLQLLF